MVPTLPVTGPVYWQAQADVVRDSATGPVILVGHSGAGPLLPLMAHGLEVVAAVFVDAGLPAAGSWLDQLPAGAAAGLRALAVDGWLPPWHEWFGGEAAFVETVPDGAQRAEFVRELKPVPWAMFVEERPAVGFDVPCGYLRLSAAYDAALAQAAAAGWPTRALDLHHLAPLTDSALVGAQLAGLVDELMRGRR